MIKSITKTVFLFILLIFFSSQVYLTKGTAPESNSAQRVLPQDAADEILQFVSGGHVLGFRKGDLFIASGDHALRVEFLNAHAVSPKEDGISDDKEKNLNKAAPMRKVSYNDLWDGVDLVYEKHSSGVVKSTYTLKPGALPESIRLRYNVPVKVDNSGNLVISFETGEMKESRPVAWQEIDGERIPVEVNFSTSGLKEVGFDVDSYDPQYPLIIDPVLIWNTFLGSSGDDYGNAIAVDGSGNVYVTGSSNATWGSPVNAFAGFSDAFAAKLNSSGALLWHTFMGSFSSDYGSGIAVDGSGNVYVAGYSWATWGVPLNAYAGGLDAFAVKLNSSGVLLWHTFLGSSVHDYGKGIAVDGSGNVYVAGTSYATWGTPVNAHAGNTDVVAAKLNSSGVLLWHTFMGSYVDIGEAIAVDGSGNVYVAGTSYATWGTPVNAHAGNYDVFAARIGRIWQKTNNTTPETAAVGDSNENGKDELVADFGSLGLWLGEAETPWVKITKHNADTLACGDLDGTGGDEFVAGFSSIGLWVYDDVSGWRKINNRNPEILACGDLDGNGQDEVIADFGSIGVWSYYNNSSWSKLNNNDLEGLTCGDLDNSGQDEVVGDFGSLGVWSYYNNSSWSKLNTHNLEGLTCGDLDGNGQYEVVADFGSIGLWSYDNSTAWRKLNNSNVDTIACGDLGGGGDEVVADFGSLGLWVYFNNIGWQKINNRNAQLLICGDVDGDNLDDVIAGFGSIGFWVWY